MLRLALVAGLVDQFQLQRASDRVRDPLGWGDFVARASWPSARIQGALLAARSARLLPIRQAGRLLIVGVLGPIFLAHKVAVFQWCTFRLFVKLVFEIHNWVCFDIRRFMAWNLQVKGTVDPRFVINQMHPSDNRFFSSQVLFESEKFKQHVTRQTFCV